MQQKQRGLENQVTQATRYLKPTSKYTVLIILMYCDRLSLGPSCPTQTVQKPH